MSCKETATEEIDKPGQVITAKDTLAATSVFEVERLINECEFVARSIKTAYPNQLGILSDADITVGRTEEGKKKYHILFKNIPGSDNLKRAGKLTVVRKCVGKTGPRFTENICMYALMMTTPCTRSME